jgi:nicotinamidase/pyrazinamidase
MPPPIALDFHDALLVIDVQNDFLPGGALAVPRGDEVLPLVNRLTRAFDNVVITQDWHPAGHVSFATTHGAKPFDAIILPHGVQTVWPDHCVQGSPGARLHDELDVDSALLILRKGANSGLDSYSAFTEADGKTTTGLAAALKARGIQRVFACGLATDFCVAHSAVDARTADFETFVIEDACRAIDADGSLEAAWARMNAAGVRRIQSGEIWVSGKRRDP